MIDLSTLELSPPSGDRETDPIKIFNSLTLRGDVKFLSGPQQEALTEWHGKRQKSDVLFSVNTGGGKTLVGLLAAQSLVNETKGKVIYACPTNQLVEQTASQGADCGIKVATYAQQSWTNRDLFDSGQSCCVTNYHALFNGFSKFYSENVKALVFDDAHVAPNIIRECFTLRIETSHAAWGPLMALLRNYFKASSFSARFTRFTTPGRYEPGVLFVPGWYVFQVLEGIYNILETGGVATENTKFAYEHLRDHIGQCAFFVSQNAIEITPSVLPTHKLPYFRTNVRRLYMTATLPTKYQSIRTFGLDKPEIVAPKGKAGAAQRLFIFAHGKDDETVYEEVRRLASSRKACIIVPSSAAASKWSDYAELYDSGLGHESIEAFRKETKPKKIILAALYDGIDLPGKSCNVLILDGVPRGSSLHDVFLEESLDIHSLRASSTAARTTQAIGRIFRSNTDHGAVILADKAQQSWLMDSENLSFLPQLLQQQIRLGFAVKSLAEAGKLKYSDLIDAVINGREDWDKFYNREVAKLNAEQKPKETKWGDTAAQQEYQAWREMWEGRYESSARLLTELATESEKQSPAHSAWYLHWAGVTLLHTEKSDDARALFWQASNKKLSLGRLPAAPINIPKAASAPGPQAVQTAKVLNNEFRKSLIGISTKLQGNGGRNAEEHESALKALGEATGFVASRPDSETGKGPDVIWVLAELKIVIAMEAKTQKESPKVYKKNKHIGKVLNDCIWLEENYKGYERRLMIVGPVCGIAPQASPPPDLRVVPMAEFVQLSERLISAAQNADARIDASNPALNAVQNSFAYYGLLWPDCIDALDYSLACDLQVEDDVDEST